MSLFTKYLEEEENSLLKKIQIIILFLQNETVFQIGNKLNFYKYEDGKYIAKLIYLKSQKINLKILNYEELIKKLERLCRKHSCMIYTSGEQQHKVGHMPIGEDLLIDYKFYKSLEKILLEDMEENERN